MPNSIHQTLQDRIRVLIVDCQAMVRSGLRYVLLAFDDLELVGEATSSGEALELCAQVQPDVVLMDPLTLEMDVVGVIRVIHQRFPRIRIIALTSFLGEELVQKVLQAGATSYLLKNVSAKDLADAIRAAYASPPR